MNAALPAFKWPGWSHLPREARDVLFLLGVIAWTVAPHFVHLPLWCLALTAFVIAWRAWRGHHASAAAAARGLVRRAGAGRSA